MDRFINSWNRQLVGKVKLSTVKFVPDLEQTSGPLSWHLSKVDIQNLMESWDKSANIKTELETLTTFLK